MYVIGISGRQGAGKDSIAKIIKKYWEPIISIESFATPLKEAIIGMFGVDRDLIFNGTSQEKLNHFVTKGSWSCSLRRLMQTFGTEGMQNAFGGDIFVEIMRERLKSLTTPIIVIPDVRFVKEYEFIRSFPNNKVVFVDRIVPDSSMYQGWEDHSSETERVKFEYDTKIDNSYDLEGLEVDVINNIMLEVPSTFLPDRAHYEGLDYNKVEDEVCYYEREPPF